MAWAAIAQAGGDSLQYGLLYLTLGELSYSLGELSQAERLFRQAGDQFAESTNGGSQVMALTNLGAVLTTLGKLEEADLVLHQSLRLGKEALGGKGIDYALILHNLGSLAISRERWSESQAHAEAAVEVFLKAAGPDSPHVANRRLLLASALEAQQQLDAAEHQIELATIGFRNSLPAGHPSIARALLKQGKVAEHREMYDRAIALTMEAVDLFRAKLGEQDRMVAIALADQARMTAYERPAEAVPIYDQALMIWTALLDRDRSHDAEVLDEVAVAALRAGMPEVGLRWFERMPEAAQDLETRRLELEAARQLSKNR